MASLVCGAEAADSETVAELLKSRLYEGLTEALLIVLDEWSPGISSSRASPQHSVAPLLGDMAGLSGAGMCTFDFDLPQHHFY